MYPCSLSTVLFVAKQKAILDRRKHRFYHYLYPMLRCNLCLWILPTYRSTTRVLPVDDEGFRYILVIGDVFSKYIEAIPLRDQNAQTISNALVNVWILKHGNPLYILSDQGSNIDGNIVTEVCNALGIEKRRTSAYHSQGNGFAERNMRSIRDILRAVILDRNISQKNWRVLLPEDVFHQMLPKASR